MKLFLIIIGIISAYVYCYFVFPTEISILQTSLKEFDFNLLHRRQPLVVQDYVDDVTGLINAWFSSNIVDNNIFFDHNRIWNINSHKYCYAYAVEDTEILVYSAANKIVNDTPDNSEPVVAIKLKKYQSVVIPFKWCYHVKNKDSIKLYGIHDYVTWGLHLFI